MGENGPLRPYRIGVRVTGIHYIDVDAVNNEHAEGQARLRAMIACRLPSGSRVMPDNSDVRNPVAKPAKPVDVRLDVVKNISVVSAERKG